jgi:hypothetical protein
MISIARAGHYRLAGIPSVVGRGSLRHAITIVHDLRKQRRADGRDRCTGARGAELGRRTTEASSSFWGANAACAERAQCAVSSK